MKTNFKYFGIFLLLFVVMSFFAFSNMVLGQDDRSAQIIETLFQSSKIRCPDTVLKDFIDGKPTARVIVNLSKPTRFQQTTNFNDMKFRKDLEESVNTVQDIVINLMDPSEFRITNRFTYIFGFSAEVTPEGLQELTEIDEVVSIEKDEILKAHLAQGIPLMNASTVRGTYNGVGTSIAICDTGIDYTHPMLGGGGFPNSKVIGGYDCGDDDTDPMDAEGHGTCCAGIAAGDVGFTGDYIGGVAYNAKLYAVKISFGSGGSAYTSDMIEGWEWCVTNQNDNPNNPIMIISTSFGGGRYFSSCDSASVAMTAAATNAVAAGMTLFVSSGNDGYCDAISWPACISHVISVGAVYDTNFGTYYPCISAESCATKHYTPIGCLPYSYWYAIDSTTADMVTSYSNTALFLGLLAPSNQAYTTDISGSGGYGAGDYYPTFGGTSAACPYAAGAAACLQDAAMWTQGSFLTPVEVRSKLASTGDLITDGKISITKPRVNLGAAVDTLSGVCTYAINPTNANVAASGGTGSVNVTTQSGCSWTAVSNDAWIHVTSGGSGTGSGTVNYSVDPNTGSARTGTMTIAGQSFTVEQAGGGGCTYAINPTSANFSRYGGTGSVNVTTQSGCSWTAVSNDAWIHVTSGHSGTGSGTVTYRVDFSRGVRTGTIIVAGETFTVYQGSGVCTYAINPTNANVAASGGTGSVNVTTQSGCSWTAVSNDAWIHVTSGGSGTGSGTVNYSVDENTGSARTGTMTIAGQTFTVYQGSEVCTYAINPTNANVAASGGTGSVNVTTQSGCSWTAVSNDAWIHVTSGGSGTGSGTVNYSVDENTGSARTGTMTIAGETFTVSQAGTGTCTYAINPTSQSFGASGGPGSVNVTTQDGCSWTASSNEPWITIISGSSGTGSGTVNYRVDRSRISRTGTMTIAGHTFTVTQRGFR